MKKLHMMIAEHVGYNYGKVETIYTAAFVISAFTASIVTVFFFL